MSIIKLHFALLLLTLEFSVAVSQQRVLLVIDVQDKFYSTEDIKKSASVMVNNINTIIGKTAPENIAYIQATATVLSASPLGVEITPQYPAPVLDPELKVVNKNQFLKIKGDAFSVEELNKYLNTIKAKEIIITGLLAEKCITKTAVGGLKKGYTVYIIPEAVIGKTEKSKEKALKKLYKKGIKELSLNDF